MKKLVILGIVLFTISSCKTSKSADCDAYGKNNESKTKEVSR